jgi:hypothetical protein
MIHTGQDPHEDAAAGLAPDAGSRDSARGCRAPLSPEAHGVHAAPSCAAGMERASGAARARARQDRLGRLLDLPRTRTE